MMKMKKINKKACPNCGLEAAVARKVCSGCNTPFVKKPTYFYEVNESEASVGGVEVAATTTAIVEALAVSPEADNRKRTVRAKREKPRFYDASEFQSVAKKRKPVATRPSSVSGNVGSSSSGLSLVRKKEEKRRRELKMRADALDEKIYHRIFDIPHKAQRMSLILQELNCKIARTSYKP